MKSLFVFLLLLTPQGFCKPKNFVPPGAPSLFYKGDIGPRRSVKMTFEFHHCKMNNELLSIKKFEYVLTGEASPTRILNLYVQHSDKPASCKKSQKIKQTYVIQPDLTRNTQFYMTLDSDITLSETNHF